MRNPSRLIDRINKLVNRAGFMLLPLLGTAACSSLLEVQAPSRVLEENLKKAASAKLLVDGTRAALGCAFQAYINGAALLTDEMEDTQLAAAAWPWDRRDWNNSLGQAYAESSCSTGQAFGVYVPLQTARFTAETAITTISGFSDEEVATKPRLLAEANLLLGYSRVLIGEGFCSAAENLGPELFPADFFTLAEASFAEAMTQAQAAANTDIERAALVGRARARLDLARLPGQPVNATKYAQAKADAALVPVNFVYNMPYSSAAIYAQNNIVQRNRLSLLYGVAANYRNLNDPRVRVTQGARGADAVSTVWYADKYASLNTPIVLASWKEAQLIIAEAELGAGNPAGAITVLDALRGRTGVALPPYAGPTDAASVQAFLVSERSKELFLEGHHFWDINRFNLALDPPVGTPYPIKGGTYADLRCLPLPDIERLNNPNLGT
ncbi:MAG TPA: RagB/SusD family nutrient uptake outer membrane protein [Gemmatimonadales bacterium]|nr:RagB/SusD family nutrient uptake outer membrane protein [Gemmatimonadales bacterium]